jgi:hypothetical protein
MFYFGEWDMNKQELSMIDSLPLLAKYKLLLLAVGIKSDDDFGANIQNIDRYKTKFREKQPIVQNLHFFDKSTKKSVIPSELILECN